MDAPPDLLAEAFEIGRGGVTGVDQEIGVLPRHHRAAADETAAAGGVDQPPRAVARRVLEGRSAGAGAHRLGGFPRGADLGQPAADRGAIAGRAAQSGFDENPARVDIAVAVGEPHRSAVDGMGSPVRSSAVAETSTSLISRP